jgi:hypothetical protein
MQRSVFGAKMLAPVLGASAYTHALAQWGCCKCDKQRWCRKSVSNHVGLALLLAELAPIIKP